MISRIAGTGLAVLAICLLAGCRDGSSGGTKVARPVAERAEQNVESEAKVKEYSTPNGPRELSLIDFKGLYNRQPMALDIGNSGDYAFFKLLREDGQHAVYSAKLDGARAEEPVELASGEEFNLAYIKAHPSRNECLVLTNYQAADGHVHNRVWRIGQGLREEIRYEGFEGFPPQHPEDFANALTPFYSWDGTQVIIASGSYGVGVCALDGSAGRFIMLPHPKIEVSGAQSGPLPDSGLGRQIYMSVWEARSRDEKCRLFMLDLDDPQDFRWHADVTWVVYRFSSPDLENQPWVLQGSRLPGYEEVRRQPKLALLDPESGAISDLDLGGHAEFNLELDSLGRQVLYMDTNKQGLVLLDRESGETKLDDRWFSDDAKLFITAGDRECYVWKKDILLHAFDA